MSKRNVKTNQRKPKLAQDYHREAEERLDALEKSNVMSEKDELLPCPFCGDKPQLEESEDGYQDVACLNVYCLVQPRALAAKERRADTTWNTRARPSVPDAVAAAREIVANWKRDIGQVVKWEQMEADIVTALSARPQQSNQPNLGLATTTQLLDEIKARVELRGQDVEME